MGRPNGLLFLGLLCLLSASALEHNVTIDDQLGDENTGQKPIFLPEVAWATQTCTDLCAIKPDITRMHNETFTAATLMPDRKVPFTSIDFSFNGTAVYIFFTLFNFEGKGITVNTECNFTIDGHHAGYFNHTGDPNRPFQRDYQVPVFSKTGLDQALHHMNINAYGVDYHVFLSFDYAIYTQIEFDVTSHKNSSSRSGVIGGVIGGICFLLGLLALFWLCRHSQQRRRATASRPFPPTILDTPSAAQVPVRHSHHPIHSASSNQSIHGSSAIASAFGSPRYLPSSTRGSLAKHMPDASTQYTRSAQDTLATTSRFSALASPPQPSGPPDELVEEVRRLRVELSHLEQGVTNSQVCVPDSGEAPPTYSAISNHTSPSVPVLYSPYTADILMSR